LRVQWDEATGAPKAVKGRGLSMMGVLTLPIWKTSTCMTQPSIALNLDPPTHWGGRIAP
jgi:hypothetical protein